MLAGKARILVNIPFLIRHVVRDIREILMRWHTRGLRSGWVCARTHAHNLAILLRERCLGVAAVECPCCGWEGVAFRAVDADFACIPQAECPQCTAQERQRMLQLYLGRHRPSFLDGAARVLHVAPTREYQALRGLLSGVGVRCFACDLDPRQLGHSADPGFSADLQALALGDNTVDAVFCVHVLEHIPSDRAALAELYRVLRPGGVAFLMVPLYGGLTATQEFGKPDVLGHVRAYAPRDFRERLARFKVEEISGASLLTQEERRRYRIAADFTLHRCTKVPAPAGR